MMLDFLNQLQYSMFFLTHLQVSEVIFLWAAQDQLINETLPAHGLH